MILKIILFLFLVSGSLSEEVQSNENEEEVEQDSECGIIYNATGFIHSGKPTGRYEYPWWEFRNLMILPLRFINFF